MDKVWIKKYIHQVNRKLVGTRKEKAEFVNGLSHDIAGYIEIHPDCTMEDILLQFGEPEDISKEFISMLDEDILRKQIRRRRWFHSFLVMTLLALVVLTAFFVREKYDFYHGHYDNTITDEFSPDFPDSLGSY